MIYVGSREIADIIGISPRRAQTLLNAFDHAGRAIHIGNRKRISISVLSEYLSRQDGSDQKEKIREIRNYLKSY